MTEREWLMGNDVPELFEVVRQNGSPRKIRLLGCACVRWAWEWGLDEEAPEAVRVAEAFADGLASEDDLLRAAGAVSALRGECDEPWRPFPRTCELTEVLASPHGAHEILHELNLFANDVYLVEYPEWMAPVVGFIHDIFGNPFHSIPWRADWCTSTARALARPMYESRDFSALPILADALQDAGCENDEILNHCRDSALHVPGCWVIDLVLGKL
jgi:hypothetical protein